MMRVLLDTNVLASGLKGLEHGISAPAEVLRRWMRQEYDLVVSDHIVDEFHRTMQNQYFSKAIPAGLPDVLIERFRRNSIFVEIIPPVLQVATHPEDDLILAAVMVGQADYLVTGDRQLLVLGSFGGAQIVTAGTFLTVLEADRPPSMDE